VVSGTPFDRIPPGHHSNGKAQNSLRQIVVWLSELKSQVPGPTKMPRAPFNVLVIPYRLSGATPEFAVLHRRPPSKMWQFIAGGGEDDETPELAARREAFEEGGIIETSGWIQLDSVASIPRTAFPEAPWPDGIYVVPEYSFAVEIGNAELILSQEHDGWGWCRYEQAAEILTWDSNRVALWELYERLSRKLGH